MKSTDKYVKKIEDKKLKDQADKVKVHMRNDMIHLIKCMTAIINR